MRPYGLRTEKHGKEIFKFSVLPCIPWRESSEKVLPTEGMEKNGIFESFGCYQITSALYLLIVTSAVMIGIFSYNYCAINSLSVLSSKLKVKATEDTAP